MLMSSNPQTVSLVEVKPMRRTTRYCVGPASMHPLITNAFVAGSTGETLVSAAKVETGLLWFMYVSTHKEGYSCKGKAKDCDSAWAYYGAQETVDGAVGLARYVREVSVEQHQDIFNAILAIRCWRESDSGETAIDDELHAQVLAQLDRALDRGIGQILMNRMERLRTESSADAEASKAFLGILGPTTHRASSAFDAALADEMMVLWAGELSESALDTLSNGINEHSVANRKQNLQSSTAVGHRILLRCIRPLRALFALSLFRAHVLRDFGHQAYAYAHGTFLKPISHSIVNQRTFHKRGRNNVKMGPSSNFRKINELLQRERQ